jgi:hypothetical protein
MKTKWTILVLIAVSFLAACAPATPINTAAVSNPATEPIAASTDAAIVNPASSDTADPAGLTYLREEEKLARDVYMYLYEQWGIQVFTNIASSEQTHTDTIKSLLNVYGLPDPAEDLEPGQFVDASLQALYNQLTAQGSLSLADAIKVGAAIEEIDILDLQTRLSSDLPADIRLAYENLLSGSYNHLAAYTSTLLRQTGETYAPQYMTVDAYQAALNQASIIGNGNGNGYRGGQP